MDEDKTKPRFQRVKIKEIRFLRELYPRFDLDKETVNQYALNLDALPPILVTKSMVLVDGYHRLVAHRAQGREEIEVEVVDIPEDQILMEATKRNALHGKQLTRQEKQKLASLFYEQGLTQNQISKILAVDQSTVSKWLKKPEQAKREAQKTQIMELYLKCHTQREIAEQVGLSLGKVNKIVQNMKSHILQNPQAPVPLPLYTHWLFAKRNPKYGLEYPGATPGQIVENVLWLYTKPFDVVVDPMAGGGTTIDVCKAMYRRCRAYDIRPVREDIKKWDITQGYPKECKGCNLIFLDPPYFKKKEKQYGPNSVSALDRKSFLAFIKKLAKDTYSTLKTGGIAALLVADWLDFQKKHVEGKAQPILAPEYYVKFKEAGFKPLNRVQIPLSAQQYTATDVEWAKRKKFLLETARDLYIFIKSED
jgi:DNA modification methylase